MPFFSILPAGQMRRRESAKNDMKLLCEQLSKQLCEQLCEQLRERLYRELLNWKFQFDF